ncbi:MAG: D-glycero-D-manno-heptose 1,7-bisphosphate phosphatase [archaeon GW2011_AR3]|nr:MAG: D-glycero-D-manno-heptose 1,7-bisphosphate phosphatase [archaeon GW2011_AR3]
MENEHEGQIPEARVPPKKRSGRNRAIFIDRDGTINVEMPTYLYQLEDFAFLPGSVEAIAKLSKTDYKLIIITNQGGVAKGIYTEEDVNKINHHIVSELKKHGAEIHRVYYCPHHKDGTVEGYSFICECKKPGTKFFEEAAHEFKLNLKKSWMVGDRDFDIMAGARAGCRTVLVKSGINGEEYYRNMTVEPDFVAPDLKMAVEIILEHEKPGGAANGANQGVDGDGC